MLQPSILNQGTLVWSAQKYYNFSRKDGEVAIGKWKNGPSQEVAWEMQELRKESAHFLTIYTHASAYWRVFEVEIV